jgi:hypothetical protein
MSKMAKTKCPLLFIQAIRESAPYMVDIYQQGSCWHFFKILKLVFPDAEPFYVYDECNSHVLTRIGGKFYDITGEVDYGHKAKPFDEHHFKGCTKYRERWWCRLSTLVKHEEARGRTKEVHKLWPI